MIKEFILFFIYSILIVLISKYVLIKILRNIAENLKLKPKIVGNIAGFTTSIPELLTVSFSAVTGLLDTAIFNVISSNIINLIQYITTIVINKNQRKLRNKAIKIDLLLVIITIIIPIIIFFLNIQINTIYILLFIMLFYIFNKISKNAHKLYTQKDIIDIEKINEKRNRKYSKEDLFINIVILILSAIGLYFIGNLLGNILEILCEKLNVPEFIVGILLGMITSIPEFITFWESQKYNKDKTSHEGIIEATSNLLFSNMMNLFIIQSVGIILFLIFA